MKNKYFISAVFGEIVASALALSLMLTAMAFLVQPKEAGAETAVTTTTTTSSPLSCVNIKNNLYLGASDRFMSGGNIAKLQNFLLSRGYFKANVTGFYGPITFAAVARFQKDNEIIPIGLAGPQTRSRIYTTTCGGSIPTPNQNAPAVTSLAPASGAVGTRVTVYGSGFDSNTTVNFGSAFGPYAQIVNSNTLSFQIPERLLPACGYGNIICMIFGPSVEIGNYPVSVKNANGTSNSINFYVTSTTNPPANTGSAPTINGVDAPTALNVNQTGSWTVRASDVTGGGLSYSVVWGDEGQYSMVSNASAASASYVSSASFTHSYAQAGTYTPRFYVRGSNGLTAEVSATVQVGANQTQSPAVSYITPSSGPYGTTVTVYGSGFTRYNNSVNYAGRSQAVTGIESTNGTSLQFTVPATPCSSGSFCAQMVMEAGTYAVSVSNQNGTSNSVNYTLTSGTSNPGNTTVNQSGSVSLGQTLAVSGTNPALSIRPVRIVEDSRCPSNVTCIQAGRVVIETSVRSGDAVQVAQMPFAAGAETSITVDGYTIKITGVTPVARQGGVNTWEYVVTYQITR